MGSINAEVTDSARDYLVRLLQDQATQDMAARVFVERGGTPQAETCMAFCPPGEEKDTDIKTTYGALTLYFDALSLSYLQDVKIDTERFDNGKETLTIKAPNVRKPAQPPKTFTLPKECTALRVPYGNPVTLPAGASVSITQALGGSFTVNYEDNLYRLSPDVAGELGLHSDIAVFQPPEDGNISEEHCWESLRRVYDPEIPVNIVSLGLVYNLTIDQHEKSVNVQMTLTSPGCGMGDVIADDVRNKLSQVPFVTSSQVDIVFDPPWSREMLSDEARVELGML